jgi:hypothetical protein
MTNNSSGEQLFAALADGLAELTHVTDPTEQAVIANALMWTAGMVSTVSRTLRAEAVRRALEAGVPKATIAQRLDVPEPDLVWVLDDHGPLTVPTNRISGIYEIADTLRGEVSHGPPAAPAADAPPRTPPGSAGWPGSGSAR